MPEGLSSAGLIGLTQRTDKRAQTQSDLANMERMLLMKKDQEAEEQKAALAEQAYYDRIRAEADKMLVGDRKKINEKSKSIQQQIRTQIKAFGGSKAKFMANGGLSLIGDYTNGVLDSEEVQIYRNNKTNLEKLLDLKEKGMGHLLVAGDQNSLEEYNRNGFGNISYSGVKSDVELPPSNLFDRGKIAGASDILGFNNNKAKIIGNYALDNPNRDMSKVTTEELLEYTKQNYRQLGSYVDPYAHLKGNRNADGTEKTDKPTYDATYGGELTRVFGPLNKPVSFKDMSKGVLDGIDYGKDLFGNKPYKKVAQINQTILEKLKFWGDDNNTYVPRGAVDLGMSKAMDLFKLQNGADTFNIEKGIITIENPGSLDDIYLANGEPVSADQKEDMKKGSYKIVGHWGGFQAKLLDGQERIVVDATTEDGKMDQERTDSLYPTEGGAEQPMGNRAIYITLEDDEGFKYYQKVHLKGSAQVSEINAALSDRGVLTDEYQEAKQNEKKEEQIINTRAIQKMAKAELEIPHQTFENNPAFTERVAKLNNYKGTDSRAKIMKAFYTTMFDIATQSNPNFDFDTYISEDPFTGFMGSLGLDEYLMDPKTTDAELMQMAIEKMSKQAPGDDDTTIQRNVIIGTKMKNYLNKVYLNKK
jgi:hypothetical protein